MKLATSTFTMTQGSVQSIWALGEVLEALGIRGSNPGLSAGPSSLDDVGRCCNSEYELRQPLVVVQAAVADASAYGRAVDAVAASDAGYEADVIAEVRDFRAAVLAVPPYDGMLVVTE